ncbi:uncharacterized protein LOC129684766, partial [Psammomys obesus]|uniref:uncharacterized protein LOC129684766 n=1 Tax=Psammomys obesus TaxID=48139 RepID=UPI0024533247
PCSSQILFSPPPSFAGVRVFAYGFKEDVAGPSRLTSPFVSALSTPTGKGTKGLVMEVALQFQVKRKRHLNGTTSSSTSRPSLPEEAPGSPQTSRRRRGTCRPCTHPTAPGPRALGAPSRRGALTCREAGRGAAPRSRRGSWPAGGAGCRARESPAPITSLRLLGPLNPRAAGRERPCARPRASGPAGFERGTRRGRPRGLRLRGERRRRERCEPARTGVGGEGAAPLPL